MIERQQHGLLKWIFGKASTSGKPIINRPGIGPADEHHSAAQSSLDCLFLYRTPKKRRYFTLLAEQALSGYCCEVQYYHQLNHYHEAIKLPREQRDAILRNAELELFNARRGWIPALLKPISRSYRKAQIKQMYSGLCHLLAQRQPKVIVVWNGHKFQDRVLLAVNKHFKIPVVYMENGVLPATTTLDFNGINARSSIPKQPQFYLPLRERSFQRPAIRGRRYRKSIRKNSTASSLPNNFILVPFQKERDSQIIDNSPWIRSMMELVITLEQAVKASGLNISLVFREHPSSRSRLDDIKRHVADSPIMSFDQRQPLADVIERAYAVITINSSVGMESLLAGKKVVVLGQAFYNIPGLTLAADSLTSLNRALIELDEFTPNSVLRARFLEYLQYDYAITQDWKQVLGQPDPEDTSNESHFNQIRQKLLPALNQQQDNQVKFATILIAQKRSYNWRDSVREFGLRYFSRHLYGSLSFKSNALNTPNTLPPQPPAGTASDCLTTLEIVSHCWMYAHLLHHQINSLICFPPQSIRVKLTVFYNKEDRDTVDLLARTMRFAVPNVHWNFRPLAKSLLFRRAIGRNIAALQSEADWIWFTDCDVIFYDQCLRDLAQQLTQTEAHLVYPVCEHRSMVLESNDAWLNPECHRLQHWELDRNRFYPYALSRATGPMQIVRGSLARHYGYCRDINIFQKPAKSWRKANEDRIYRHLLGTPGHALPIADVLRIQHQEKGRYLNRRWRRLRKRAQQLKFKRWAQARV